MPVSRPATADELYSELCSLDDAAVNAAAAACDGVGHGDRDDDFMEVVAMPPAHRQLLSRDRPWSATLTGYDHRRWDDLDVMGGFDWISNDDCNNLDDDDGCDDLDRSVGRERGGGSWLLGPLALALPDADMRRRAAPPDLVSASSASDEDSNSSATSSLCSGAEDASLPSRGRRGVSFAPTVAVRPIPHSSELSPAQRRRMFATSAEVRRNKARARKEFRHDGGDWRAAAEEWQMGVDMATGELVHPAHRCEDDV